jgi:hypothetical protein
MYLNMEFLPAYPWYVNKPKACKPAGRELRRNY